MCVRVSADCFRMYARRQEAKEEAAEKQKKIELERAKKDLERRKKQTPDFQPQIESMKQNLRRIKKAKQEATDDAKRKGEESAKLSATAKSTWFFWGEKARQKEAQ